MSLFPPLAPSPAPPVHPPSDHAYIPLSRRIVHDLCDSPVAVGVAALVARRFQAGDITTWLSRHDLCGYDPALSYGAAARALTRIVACGAAVQTKGCGKFGYRPAWGVVKGQVLPYDRKAPNGGCPRHIAQVRIDTRLLDTCLGRLIPHPRHRAEVRRYFPTPLFSLHDLGTYILLQAGFAAPTTPTLTQRGLVNSDGTPQPLPPDATLLALASQQQGQLTDAGYRHCGLPVPATPPPAAASGDPLPFFFAPGAMIGSMIGCMIGGRSAPATPPESSSDAPKCAKPPRANAPKRSHGIKDMYGVKADPPPTPRCGGGGGRLSGREEAQQGVSDTVPSDSGEGIVGAVPNTPTAQYLMSNHVRLPVVQALADVSLADAEAAFADARSRPHVRDVTAWAVSLLQDAQRTGRAITPPERGGQVDWGAEARRYAVESCDPAGADTPPVAPAVPELPLPAPAVPDPAPSAPALAIQTPAGPPPGDDPPSTLDRPDLAPLVPVETVLKRLAVRVTGLLSRAAPAVLAALRATVDDATVTLAVPPPLLPGAQAHLNAVVLRQWACLVERTVRLVAGSDGTPLVAPQEADPVPLPPPVLTEAQVRQALDATVEACHAPLLARLRVDPQPSAIWLWCAAPSDHVQIQALLPAPVLREVGRDLGRPVQLGVQIVPATGVTAPSTRAPAAGAASAPPAWVPLTHWESLSPLFQAALVGSQRRADGTVAGRGMFQQGLLTTRYAEDVAALCQQLDQGGAFQ